MRLADSNVVSVVLSVDGRRPDLDAVKRHWMALLLSPFRRIRSRELMSIVGIVGK